MMSLKSIRKKITTKVKMLKFHIHLATSPERKLKDNIYCTKDQFIGKCFTCHHVTLPNKFGISAVCPNCNGNVVVMLGYLWTEVKDGKERILFVEPYSGGTVAKPNLHETSKYLVFREGNSAYIAPQTKIASGLYIGTRIEEPVKKIQALKHEGNSPYVH